MYVNVEYFCDAILLGISLAGAYVSALKFKRKYYPENSYPIHYHYELPVINNEDKLHQDEQTERTQEDLLSRKASKSPRKPKIFKAAKAESEVQKTEEEGDKATETSQEQSKGEQAACCSRRVQFTKAD
jgi:hypothetical protein